jgi:hypothetical protein
MVDFLFMQRMWSVQATRRQAAAYHTHIHGFSCTGCTSCGLLEAKEGIFTDGSGSNPYSNNANCVWMIAPTGGANIVTINFTEFNTLHEKDSVRVIACANAACVDETDFMVLSGTYHNAQVIMSITGFMKVKFESDSAGSAPGFSATWNSVSICVCHCVKHTMCVSVSVSVSVYVFIHIYIYIYH